MKRFLPLLFVLLSGCSELLFDAPARAETEDRDSIQPTVDLSPVMDRLEKIEASLRAKPSEPPKPIDPPKPQEPSAQVRPVFVYSPANCPMHARVNADVQAAIANGIGTDLEFRFVSNPDAFPVWVWRKHPAQACFVELYWEAQPNQWRSQSGWSGMDAFLKNFNTAPAMQSAPQQAAPVGYPIHAVAWHMLGVVETRETLINHLLYDPEHRHEGFRRKWLETLSLSQLQTLHDDSHNARVNRAYVRSMETALRAQVRADRRAAKMASRASARQRFYSNGGFFGSVGAFFFGTRNTQSTYCPSGGC